MIKIRKIIKFNIGAYNVYIIMILIIYLKKKKYYFYNFICILLIFQNLKY